MKALQVLAVAAGMAALFVGIGLAPTTPAAGLAVIFLAAVAIVAVARYNRRTDGGRMPPKLSLRDQPWRHITELEAELAQLRGMYDDSQTWHRRWMDRAAELEGQLASAVQRGNELAAAGFALQARLGDTNETNRQLTRELAKERDDHRLFRQKWARHIETCKIAQAIGDEDAAKARANT